MTLDLLDWHCHDCLIAHLVGGVCTQPAGRARQRASCERATNLARLSCPVGAGGSPGWTAPPPAGRRLDPAPGQSRFVLCPTGREMGGLGRGAVHLAAHRAGPGSIRLWVIGLRQSDPQRAGGVAGLAGSRCAVGRRRPASETAFPIAAPRIHPAGRSPNGGWCLARRSLASHCPNRKPGRPSGCATCCRCPRGG